MAETRSRCKATIRPHCIQTHRSTRAPALGRTRCTDRKSVATSSGSCVPAQRFGVLLSKSQRLLSILTAMLLLGSTGHLQKKKHHPRKPSLRFHLMRLCEAFEKRCSSLSTLTTKKEHRAQQQQPAAAVHPLHQRAPSAAGSSASLINWRRRLMMLLQRAMTLDPSVV